MPDYDSQADSFVDKLLKETREVIADRKQKEEERIPSVESDLDEMLESMNKSTTRKILNDPDPLRSVGRYLRHTLRGEL